MLLTAGVGEQGDIERARETSQGFGRFVRSLVGLDHAAAREAFSEFLSNGAATAAQIEFINMIIEHLTDQVFDEEKVTRLFAKIQAINESAGA